MWVEVRKLPENQRAVHYVNHSQKKHLQRYKKQGRYLLFDANYDEQNNKKRRYLEALYFELEDNYKTLYAFAKEIALYLDEGDEFKDIMRIYNYFRTFKFCEIELVEKYIKVLERMKDER